MQVHPSNSFLPSSCSRTSIMPQHPPRTLVPPRPLTPLQVSAINTAMSSLIKTLGVFPTVRGEGRAGLFWGEWQLSAPAVEHGGSQGPLQPAGHKAHAFPSTSSNPNGIFGCGAPAVAGLASANFSSQQHSSSQRRGHPTLPGLHLPLHQCRGAEL